jgi:hypothetical protein
MTIADMLTKILAETGMHLLLPATVESYVMSTASFIQLVKSTLAPINGSQPRITEETIAITDSYKTFSTPYPEDIVDVIPIFVFGVPSRVVLDMIHSRVRTTAPHGSIPAIKHPAPWVYDRPTFTLYSGIGDGDYTIKRLDYYSVTEISEGSGTYEVLNIDDNFDEFFELLKGKFMVSVGMSRRAFTLNELPVTMDADTMVSEGKEIIEAALEDITDTNSKWYQAWT